LSLINKSAKSQILGKLLEASLEIEELSEELLEETEDINKREPDPNAGMFIAFNANNPEYSNIL
jgi:hypothetical protein